MANRWGNNVNSELVMDREAELLQSMLLQRVGHDRATELIPWRKDSLFNKLCWKHWVATGKRVKLKHSVTPHVKVNSKE